MELSKKLAVQYPAKTLSGADISATCLREEAFDLIVDLDLYKRVFITPDNLDEFVIGTLIGAGIIQTQEGILGSRLCDANRFFIQLEPELTKRVRDAGGIREYAQDLAVPAEIFPLSDGALYPIDEIITHAKRYDTHVQYYAANPLTSTIACDCGGVHAIDKIIGAGEVAFITTNANPTMEAVIHSYRGGVEIAIFAGVPTSGAINFAQKAGLTMISKDLFGNYTVYADSAKRLVYR